MVLNLSPITVGPDHKFRVIVPSPNLIIAKD